MTEDRRNPPYLLWLDLETSGLDPHADHVIEMAFVLTQFEHPYRPTGSSILPWIDHERSIKRWIFDPPFDYEDDIDYEGGLTEFIREMHEASGLLAERRRIPRYLRQAPGSFEEMVLLPMSETWPTAKDEKVMLAGNSVHFDLGFIRTKFPSFAKRLSHRVHDVSAVRSFCNSLGMPRGPKTVEAHRAAADVLASLSLASDCVDYLSDGLKNWLYGGVGT